MTLTQEEMHVQNEHRFTRLEIMVAGLYFIVLGSAVVPMVVPAFLSILRW